MGMTVWLALLSGIAVAAACGLRAFLPLLMLGLASRLGLLQLRGGADWLASDLALIALGVATVLEVAGDKIPVVDHALDAVGTVLRPAAAWLGAYAVLQSWPTPWAQIAAIVLGTTALGVHALKAKLRLGSSAVTLGMANPVASVIEDGFAFVTMVVAVLAPILALLLLGGLLVMALRRRRRPAT
jgi:uncharacterized protein DUF4126